jgi:hypothetical protein
MFKSYLSGGGRRAKKDIMDGTCWEYVELLGLRSFLVMGSGSACKMESSSGSAQGSKGGNICYSKKAYRLTEGPKSESTPLLSFKLMRKTFALPAEQFHRRRAHERERITRTAHRYRSKSSACAVNLPTLDPIRLSTDTSRSCSRKAINLYSANPLRSVERASSPGTSKKTSLENASNLTLLCVPSTRFR